MTPASTTTRLTRRGAARLHQLATHASTHLTTLITRLDHATARLTTTSGPASGHPVDPTETSGSPLPTHFPRPTDLTSTNTRQVRK
ncbi:hypothetical protein ATK36_3766 [Amycolatopsis sulphurea]|uniref:Uncharacterized protein n=1 Tax=Amycolatopsis sulphurea TaxID=76022 RepID=A0A2A9FBD2_9PSEU|nr:hypothetical protein ATK36_3766 [Amycolatopsis sulphurea]